MEEYISQFQKELNILDLKCCHAITIRISRLVETMLKNVSYDNKIARSYSAQIKAKLLSENTLKDIDEKWNNHIKHIKFLEWDNEMYFQHYINSENTSFYLSTLDLYKTWKYYKNHYVLIDPKRLNNEGELM